MMYVHTKVWLRTPQGVTGWSVEEINRRIDYWNSHKSLYMYGSFWDWLSYEEGETYYGFSLLWASNLMSKVHTIKGGE